MEGDHIHPVIGITEIALPVAVHVFLCRVVGHDAVVAAVVDAVQVGVVPGRVVRDALAIVVDAVAALHGSRVDGGARVVAVPGADAEAVAVE
ncbi:MAG TPA: hypothetical protein VNI57_15370, partial [Candidatus Saccharimonadales bacterium]|nr:hypothetical protein [Candidatus Saccharimonadales bacterium]